MEEIGGDWRIFVEDRSSEGEGKTILQQCNTIEVCFSKLMCSDILAVNISCAFLFLQNYSKCRKCSKCSASKVLLFLCWEGDRLKTHQMSELRFQFEGGRLGRSVAHHQISSLAVENSSVHTTAVHRNIAEHVQIFWFSASNHQIPNMLLFCFL